ncbi:hypothetical protein ACLOJK_041785 [Asimina triloba]
MSADNFWEMGDTGPCGPCTEIHFDRIGNRDAAALVNNDDPTCIEIWNLVFIQFNRESDGSLKPLPAKHVDTGMGFERLTSVLQKKMSNYDTDVFLPIFDAIQKETGARPYSGKVGADDVDKVDMAYRVVADHVRTLSFAIADGSCPGNDGREYVLRRILRRAVRYGKEVLKAEEGFFSRLVSAVMDVMGDIFPELKLGETNIRNIIAEEETSFGRTLVKGIERFKKAAQEVQGNVFGGQASLLLIHPYLQLAYHTNLCLLQDAFVLWDTYGFPVDLTQLMAEEKGLAVDMEGFNKAMDEAREKSRNASSKQVGDSIAMDADATSELHKRGVTITDDSSKFIWFLEEYYSKFLRVLKLLAVSIYPDRASIAIIQADHKSSIKAIYNGVEFLEKASAGAEVGILLDSTSFYAEQGGQIYDTGSLEGTSGSFKVGNVQIYGGFVLHIGSFVGETGVFSVGDEVICKVDYARRILIAPNHTCTHMLNFALRGLFGPAFEMREALASLVLAECLALLPAVEVLGDHVDQKGSIVLPEKLRFDFSHGKPIHPNDLRKIESIVNDQIKDELDVFASETRLSNAKRIAGLRAVFGEVYPDPVRVVSIGRNVKEILTDPENKQWLSISTELCGGQCQDITLLCFSRFFMSWLLEADMLSIYPGTHISNTREAKAFALLSEEGIAKGIRRVTAVTAECALKALEIAWSFDQEISDAYKAEGRLLAQSFFANPEPLLAEIATSVELWYKQYAFLWGRQICLLELFISWTKVKMVSSSDYQMVASLKSRLDAAAIPAAMKADLRTRITQLDGEVRKAQKKIGEENIQKAVKSAVEIAEAAASEGKSFCIAHVDVGVDATAIREAALKVLEQKGIPVMVFSTDGALNKAVVCAGVPPEIEKNGLAASKWLAAAVEPLKGKGGGKAGLAQGQGSDASRVQEAIDVATRFASLQLR